MNDLTTFLKARVDDDERHLSSNRERAWTRRPLREVAAMRVIMAEHGECEEMYDGERDVCVTLRALASIYSDHDDYRQEWAL